MMHPCPFCGSTELVVNMIIDTNRSLSLTQVAITPPRWGYYTDQDTENVVVLGEARCDTCARPFRFNLDAYQAGRRPVGDVPHPFMPSGPHQDFLPCHPRCEACTWEAVMRHASTMLAQSVHGRPTPQGSDPNEAGSASH